jgi:hypothetical protein
LQPKRLRTLTNLNPIETLFALPGTTGLHRG